MLNQQLIRQCTSLLQYFLIFIDVMANVLSDFNEIDLFIRLSLYIVQDVALLISLIILILLLFQKHILLNKLLMKTFLHFSFQIVLILIYLILTFILQSINVTSDQQHLQNKSKRIIYLFIIQRILAALYYVQYKNFNHPIKCPYSKMSAISTFDIKLDRLNKIYQEGETINGKLYFDTKTEIKHDGINLWLEGFVNLQTTSKNMGILETFSNTVKPTCVIYQSIELPKVFKISAGKSEIPFSVQLKAKPNKTLYETYHGVFIMIQYLIKCEIRRSILNANLQRSIEVIIERRTKIEDYLGDKSISFTITPNTSEDTNQDISKFPNFKIVGSIDNVNCKLSEPLTGGLLIENSDTPIRSIELQLTRIETCGLIDEQFTIDATEVQRIQIADGNILRNNRIPLYMLFPRLFTCSTLVARNFKIEFEINVIITFEGNYLVKEAFPLRLVRT